MSQDFYTHWMPFVHFSESRAPNLSPVQTLVVSRSKLPKLNKWHIIHTRKPPNPMSSTRKLALQALIRFHIFTYWTISCTNNSDALLLLPSTLINMEHLASNSDKQLYPIISGFLFVLICKLLSEKIEEQSQGRSQGESNI